MKQVLFLCPKFKAFKNPLNLQKEETKMKKNIAILVTLMFILSFGLGGEISWAATCCTTPPPPPTIRLLSQISTVNSRGYGSVSDMQLVGNNLYTGGLGASPYFDTSNPSSPIKYQIQTSNVDLSYAIKVANNMFYAVGPYILGVWTLPGLTPYQASLGGPRVNSDVEVVGNKAYIVWQNNSGQAAGRSGVLEIWDVSNPSNMVQLGFKAWSDYPNGQPTYSPNSIIVSGSYAYIGTEGLRIFNVSNPSNIIEEGRFNDVWVGTLVHDKDDMVKVGDRIYKAHRALGILVINVYFPKHPVLEGIIGSSTIPLGDIIAFKVVGNRMFVATRSDRKVRVLDIADVRNPRVLASRTIDSLSSGTTLEIEVDATRRLAFVAGENILDIYDVSDFLPAVAQ